MTPANNLRQNGPTRIAVALYLSTIIKLDVKYHIDGIVNTCALIVSLVDNWKPWCNWSTFLLLFQRTK